MTTELDAEVAKTIMGWNDGKNPNYWWRSGEAVYQQANGYHSDFETWQPTKNANHAFAVVERMRQRGFSFGLWQTCNVSSVIQDTVVAFNRSVHPPEFNGLLDPNAHPVAGKMAEAVCIAALKAIAATRTAY